MSKAQEIDSTILFADIAGSTRLYQELGDQTAQKIIATTLKLLSQTVLEFNGLVIKSIGDEVMCRFEEADHAIYAACAMNEVITENPILDIATISLHIGVNTGVALIEDDDVFGDVVNIASRVTNIATANKIIITKATAEAVSKDLYISRLRSFDREHVKGVDDKQDLYEVLWNPNDATRIATGALTNNSLVPANNEHQLLLTIQNQKHLIKPNEQNFEIGRGRHCHLCLDVNLASRSHAFIGYKRGKYIYQDNSTNGSFIQTENGQQFYIKREEMPLAGNGMISLGKPIAEAGNEIIHYKAD